MNKKLFFGLALIGTVLLSSGCATDEAAFYNRPSLAGPTESRLRPIPFIETPGSNQSKLPDERSPAIDGRSNITETSGGYKTSPFARKRQFYGAVPPGIH